MEIHVGIMGATGYAGLELVRLVSGHPHFTLTVATSNADAGKPIAYTSWDERATTLGLTESGDEFGFLSQVPEGLPRTYARHDDPAIFNCDLVFLAIPHTQSLAITPRLIEAGIHVVDLSADYRLKSAEVYERWYGCEHTSPDLLKRASFGLPEIYGEELTRAHAAYLAHEAFLIACAGCYPTASSLAAFPALDAGWVDTPIHIAAISGFSGAGKTPSPKTHFCQAADNACAYGVTSHRHTPEIEQILGIPDGVVFVPHLAPVIRGLHSCVYMNVRADVAADLTEADIRRAYEQVYGDASFVHLLPAGVAPQTAAIKHTNHALVQVNYDARTHTIVGTCAIDNISKGAAAQAIQCANIALGFDERAGLSVGEFVR